MADNDFGMHTHTDGSGMQSRQVKDAVVLSRHLCARIDVNGQAALPSGDDDVNARYNVFTLDSALAGENTITGDDDAPKRVTLAAGQPSVPFISASAIEAGKRVGAKGTDGRVYQTAAAGFGTALNSVGAADQTVYVQQD